MRSHWDDDPDYLPADWQYEVANGDTRQSYAEWVENQRDSIKAELRGLVDATTKSRKGMVK